MEDVASIRRSRRVSHTRICISANTLATMLVSGDTGRACSASRSKAEAVDQGHTNGRSANMHTWQTSNVRTWLPWHSNAPFDYVSASTTVGSTIQPSKFTIAFIDSIHARYADSTSICTSYVAYTTSYTYVADVFALCICALVCCRVGHRLPWRVRARRPV